ncbi:hypothetical protein [Agromyces soli]|uniref:ABC transporter permease n=1 Tax=Agromyces soli TaxID=659012 RepID=A0ABY4AVY8_9MICO|nr:hypothetical protein [Agromyces soli]UOE27185.1 hypothetical protein MTP13_05215 [Agromyces soli]
MVLTGLTIADATITRQEIESAAAFRQSGGATFILSAPGEIDAAACDALGRLPNVSAAGAIRDTGKKLAISTLPDAPVPSFDTSAGFAAIIGADVQNRAGLVISEELAATLNVSAGDEITTRAGTTNVAGTYSYPNDGRRPGLGYAALSSTVDEAAFDECWISAWPQITNARAILFTALQPKQHDNEDQATVTQLNSTYGIEFRGADAFLGRVTRYALPVAVLVAFLLGFTAVRQRKLQIASSLHAGLPRVSLIAIHALEALVWSAPAVLLTLGIAVVIAQQLPAEDRLAVIHGLAPIAMSALIAPIGAAIAAAATSERNLFRYFKDR